MVLIHCTEKLRKSLGIVFDTEKHIGSNNAPLQEWYANLFTFERRKHVIATNASTLYSVVIRNVSKRDKESLGSRIAKAVSEAMYYLDCSEEEIGRVRSIFEEVTYLKTQNRQVLGSMNEFLIHLTNHWAEHPEEIDGSRSLKVIHEIPMSYLGYKCPMKVFRETLQGITARENIKCR